MVLALAMVFVLVMSTAVLAEGNEPEDAISNVLEVNVNVAGEDTGGTIAVNDDLAEKIVAGLWDVFSVSTTPPDNEEALSVKGKVVVVGEGDPAGFKLEYLEQDTSSENYGKFLPMNFDGGAAYFGPSGGFPWVKVEHSVFRVTWKEAGEYTFNIYIVDANNDEVLAETEGVTVQVMETGQAINLKHAYTDEIEVENGEPQIPGGLPILDGGSLTINPNIDQTFGYWVKAELEAGFSHVDGVRYVFEVTKGSSDVIAVEDLEIKYFEKQADYDVRTLGLTKEDGKLTGVFGPAQGFTFYGGDGEQLLPGIPGVESPVVTPFKVKFNTEGEYNVRIYAIQVEPVPALNTPVAE